MTETVRELGVITGADFFYEDHGILTCFIDIDFGTSYQSFGGYPLDTYSESEKRRIGTAAGMEFLIGVMDAVGVERWGALKGKEIFVERDRGKITVIEAPAYRKHRRFIVAEWQQKWTHPDGKVKV